MKKIMAVLALSFSAIITSGIVNAAPQPSDEHNFEKNDRGGKRFDRSQRDANFDQDQRKQREERGVKRLQQHKWQPGYVMPQHYRGNSYKADYKENNLPKPSHNQQWYKINNDYILVDSDNNNILKIQED